MNVNIRNLPDSKRVNFTQRCLFVCLFVCLWDMQTSPLPVKGCKFWHNFMLGSNNHWAVSVFSMSHLLWNGTSFIMVISWHSPSRAFKRKDVNTCFKDLGLSRLGFEHLISACGANTLIDCATAAAFYTMTYV